MKQKKGVWQALVMLTQFSINMLVPIVLCTVAGAYIGERYDMKWISVPLFFLGAVAGGQNCYRMAKQLYKDEKKR